MAKIGIIARNLRSAGELLMIQGKTETPVFNTLPPDTFGIVSLSLCVCVMVGGWMYSHSHMVTSWLRTLQSRYIRLHFSSLQKEKQFCKHDA